MKEYTADDPKKGGLEESIDSSPRDKKDINFIDCTKKGVNRAIEDLTKDDKYSHYISREYEIISPDGLHARPAAIIVQSLNKYEGNVLMRTNEMTDDEITTNAKGILQILKHGDANIKGKRIKILYEPGFGDISKIEKPLKDILKPVKNHQS